MNKKWPFSRTRANAVGPVVKVLFPGLKISEPVEAKIDTGAYSGALHATDIREISGKQGRKLIEFTPLGQGESVRLEAYREKLVRSSNGQSEKRFVIDTEISFGGAVYPISISLADRRKLKYPVIIGRKFLETHSFLVDLRIDTE